MKFKALQLIILCTVVVFGNLFAAFFASSLLGSMRPGIARALALILCFAFSLAFTGMILVPLAGVLHLHVEQWRISAENPSSVGVDPLFGMISLADTFFLTVSSLVGLPISFFMLWRKERFSVDMG